MSHKENNLHKGERRCLVIGLDGMTFDLISPWMENGCLPTLSFLRANGVSGILRSTIPPLSPPAWASFATGCNPGKHGIFDFKGPLDDSFQRPLISSDSVKGPKFWHILNRHGKKVGLVNLPIMYPPEKVDGFSIAGMMTPGEDCLYTYPPDLQETLQARIGRYVVNIENQQYVTDDEATIRLFLDDVLFACRKRFEAVRYLMEEREWDCMAVVFILPDRIQHRLWKYLHPDSALYRKDVARGVRERAIECYKVMDGELGELLGKIDDDTDVLILSDHGFGPLEAFININRMLEEMGMLRCKRGKKLMASLFHQGVKLKKSEIVRKLLPRGLNKQISGKIRSNWSLVAPGIEGAIDWEGTRAYFPSIAEQGIHIRTEERMGAAPPHSSEEYLDIRTRIKERLETLVDPHTGERIVDDIFFKEDLYHGPFVSRGPDVTFLSRNYTVLGRETIGTDRLIQRLKNDPRGFHNPEGIFFAYGRSFREGAKLEGAAIEDLAPTILYLMGAPIPRFMDGAVLKDAFQADFINSHPVHYTEEEATDESKGPGHEYTGEESRAIEERLRDLGYSD